MTKDISGIRYQLESTLASAVQYLIEARQPQGHWGDVRSTAMVVWALQEFSFGDDGISVRGPSDMSPQMGGIIEDARTWLAGQAKREEGGISWDSEAWDTSLAIVALIDSGQFAERRDQAAAWLQRIRCAPTGVWYDEIWETTLCSVSLLRAELARTGPRQSLAGLFKDVLFWLQAIPSKASGEFINTHYSGFIAWIMAEVLSSSLRDELQRSDMFSRFSQKVDSAVQFLINKAEIDPIGLWGPYTFANAYVTYGLLRLMECHPHEPKYLKPAVEWFGRQQGRSGGYEDTEDTAVAVLALTQALSVLDIHPESLLKRISYPQFPLQRLPLKFFIGYSGKSSGLAAQLKEFILRALPDVSIRDWKWDFQIGHILFSEIDSASRECSAALFLVTKDDQIAWSDQLISSPRDNIVFEVGFFAARLGMAKTVLIVEEGTKLPTDWGGILYIPMKTKDDLTSVHSPLLFTLKDILGQK